MDAQDVNLSELETAADAMMVNNRFYICIIDLGEIPLFWCALFGLVCLYPIVSAICSQ